MLPVEVRYGGTRRGSPTWTRVESFKVDEDGHTLKYLICPWHINKIVLAWEWAFNWTLYQTCLVFARERSLSDVVIFKDAFLSGHDWTDEVTFAYVRSKICACPYPNLIMCKQD